jgi:hypothetical protein
LNVAQLIGAELLAAMKALGPVSKGDLLRATGYVSTKEDGTERLNYTAFNEAVLEANGVTIDTGRNAVGGGRTLSYFARQQAKGMIVIGAGYTEQLGFEPGQLFKIEVNAELGQITVTAAEEREEADA